MTALAERNRGFPVPAIAALAVLLAAEAVTLTVAMLVGTFGSPYVLGSG